MLTREDILAQLRKDRNWQPDENVSDDDWVLFEEVKEEFEDENKLNTDEAFDEDEELDDDDAWDDDDDDF